jgi:hypothetical protein
LDEDATTGTWASGIGFAMLGARKTKVLSSKDGARSHEYVAVC